MSIEEIIPHGNVECYAAKKRAHLIYLLLFGQRNKMSGWQLFNSKRALENIMVTSSGILQAYLIQSSQNDTKLSYKQLIVHHRNALIDHKLQSDDGGFSSVLAFHLAVLADTDKILITYMSTEQKQQLAHDLRSTYLLLLAQIEYELTHQKTENLANYYQSLKSCAALLDGLNPGWQNDFDKVGTCTHEYSTDKTAVSYLGIALAKEFAEQLVSIGTTKNIKTFVKGLNEKRLYWVWGSSFLKTMLSLAPDTFYNVPQANALVPLPDPFTGSLSWGLYYFRFALNCFLLLKHTCAHPWMSAEESAVPWQDRFKIQWNMRKFSLLNDSIWGVANFLCFFWLTGAGFLGTVGDAVTIGLLLFDTIVSIWDFEEQKTLHEAQRAQYTQDINTIKDKIKALEREGDNQTEIQRLTWQLNSLEREEQQCIANWALEKISLYNNMIYAIGLMLAFVVMTMPFVPFTAATALAFGVTGAVICFTLTVINNAIQSGIELYKTKNALANYEQAFDKIMQQFKNNPQDENPQKLLFLELQRLEALCEYHQQTADLQTAHLIRSVIMEVCTPAILFASLVFFPLTIGLGIIALGLGLALLSNYLIERTHKVEQRLLTVTEFNSNEFDHFRATIRDEPKDEQEEKPKDKETRDYHSFFRKITATAHANAINNTAPLGLPK